jgi:hypothetical protein
MTDPQAARETPTIMYVPPHPVFEHCPCTSFSEHRDVLDALRARAVAARETLRPDPLTPAAALERYGRHDPTCEWSKRGQHDDPAFVEWVRRWDEAGCPCSCGLLAALRAATPDPAEPPERFDRTWSHYADDCPTPPGYDRAASTVEPGLDVERLARALTPAFGPSYFPGLTDVTLFGESVEVIAAAIAAEYAAALTPDETA